MNPESYKQADERAQRFDRALREYLQQHPPTSAEWQTPEPYVTMLAATERYAEASIKDAIWAFAQAYVDIASTGYIGKADTTHAEIPAEFQTLFDDAMRAVETANASTPGEEIQLIYRRLWDIMWDAISMGIFLRLSVGLSSAVVRGHLYANETVLRQAAETIYEIKVAAQRLGPIALSLASWQTTGGNPPPPLPVSGLVFYTETKDGNERPPVWAEIHAANTASPILVDISRRTGETFREIIKDAAGVDAVKSATQGFTDIMDDVGGLSGAIMWAVGIAGGLYLFRTLTRD